MNRGPSKHNRKNARRRARYAWALSTGAPPDVVEAAALSIKGLLRVLGHKNPPAELLAHRQPRGKVVFGPRTLDSHERAMRYMAARAIGCDSPHASEACVSEGSFKRVKREMLALRRNMRQPQG